MEEPSCVGFYFNTTDELNVWQSCCECPGDPFEFEKGVYSLIGNVIGVWGSDITLTILSILCLFCVVLVFAVFYPFVLAFMTRLLLLCENAFFHDVTESRKREVLEGLPRLDRIDEFGCCYCCRSNIVRRRPEEGPPAMTTEASSPVSPTTNSCCARFARVLWNIVVGMRVSETFILVIIGLLLRCFLHVVTLSDPEINEHLEISFNPNVLDYFFWPPMMLSFGLGLDWAPADLFCKHGYTIVTTVVNVVLTAFAGGFLMYLAASSDLEYDFMDGLFFGVMLSVIEFDGIFGSVWYRETNSRLAERLEVESVIRDVSAFTLYGAFEGYAWEVSRDDMKLGDFPQLFGLFLVRFAVIWLLSLLVGAAVGISATLLSRFTFKHSNRFLQPGIVLVFAYLTVAICEMVLSSGALGTLFYAFFVGAMLKPDMSEKSRTTLTHVLDLMEQVFDMLIYVSIGMSIGAGIVLGRRMDWPLVFAGVGIFYVLRILSVALFDLPYNFVLMCCHKIEKIVPWSEIVVRAFCWCRGSSAFYMAFIIPIDSEFFPRSALILRTVVLIIFFSSLIQIPIANVVLSVVPLESDPLDLEALVESWKDVLDSLQKLVCRISDSRDCLFFGEDLRVKIDDALAELRHKVEILRDWVLDEFEDGEESGSDEEMKIQSVDSIGKQAEVDPGLGSDEPPVSFEALQPGSVTIVESFHSVLAKLPGLHLHGKTSVTSEDDDILALLKPFAKFLPELSDLQLRLQSHLKDLLYVCFQETLREPSEPQTCCKSGTSCSKVDFLKIRESRWKVKAMEALFEYRRYADLVQEVEIEIESRGEFEEASVEILEDIESLESYEEEEEEEEEEGKSTSTEEVY